MLSLRDMPKQKTGTLNIPEAKKAEQSGKIAKEGRNPTYCVYEPSPIPDSLTGLFTITHFILMPLTHLQMRASRQRDSVIAQSLPAHHAIPVHPDRCSLHYISASYILTTYHSLTPWCLLISTSCYKQNYLISPQNHLSSG